MVPRLVSVPGNVYNLLQKEAQDRGMERKLTGIPRAEALRYLGVRGEPDARLTADLDRCEAQLCAAAVPRVCWRSFAREADGTLTGTSFRPGGEAIARHLAGCGQVLLMAATLGAETERLIRRAQVRSMADAALLDALASAAVENVCDRFCEELAARFSPQRLTSRFSPGYGDFPLSQQREVCRILNVQRMLGMTLTPGGLMIPQKSVTALIGVSDSEAPSPARPRCADCPAAGNCRYRKEDTFCESI